MSNSISVADPVLIRLVSLIDDGCVAIGLRIHLSLFLINCNLIFRNPCHQSSNFGYDLFVFPYNALSHLQLLRLFVYLVVTTAVDMSTRSYFRVLDVVCTSHVQLWNVIEALFPWS